MICYYHNRDLDGFCSGAIMHRKFPEAQFIGYDYGQPFEQIVGEEIIMADVSLPMPTMSKVAQLSTGFTWIDHHASAIKDFTDFFKTGSPIKAVLRDGIAACEIAWAHFFPDEQMPMAVRLLGEYDTWRNADKGRWENEILPFQYGMRLLCNSLESFPSHLLRGGNESTMSCYAIIGDGQTVLRYQKQQDEMACRLAAFEATFKGLRAICLNTGTRNSQTFESVWDEEKHDIMLPFSFNGKEWTFSLYTTKDEVDCSVLAKEMGGGGHKKAAGFKVANFYDVFPA